MSLVVQICVVVVTIAVVLVAIVAARVMLQLESATKHYQAAYPNVMAILEDLRQTSLKVGELTAKLEKIAGTVHKGAERVEVVVGQAASLSSMVLDELEPPTRQAVAVMRGLQAFVRVLSHRWARSGSRQALSNQGARHA